MADSKHKNPENAPGAWFVDHNCIICGMCADIAPEVFRPDSEAIMNIVYKQPENEAELARAREALEGCPVDAIGCDTQ